jgi:hypothetical protein
MSGPQRLVAGGIACGAVILAILIALGVIFGIGLPVLLLAGGIVVGAVGLVLVVTLGAVLLPILLLLSPIILIVWLLLR